MSAQGATRPQRGAPLARVSISTTTNMLLLLMLLLRLISVAGHSSSVGLGHMLRAARIAQSILTTCRALGAYLRRNSHTLLCASIAIQYFVNSTIVPLFDETMSRDNASSRGCHRGRRVPAAMGPSCGMVQRRPSGMHQWWWNAPCCLRRRPRPPLHSLWNQSPQPLSSTRAARNPAPCGATPPS